MCRKLLTVGYSRVGIQYLAEILRYCKNHRFYSSESFWMKKDTKVEVGVEYRPKHLVFRIGIIRSDRPPYSLYMLLVNLSSTHKYECITISTIEISQTIGRGVPK